MQNLRPESAAAMTAHRREAVRLAKAQERAVTEKCVRSGQEAPGYAFDELIGKGSFGRVYKGRQMSTNKVVAVKVIDIDDADFQAYGDMKDEQIRDFNREIQILRRAQESGAQNLNQMIEALPVHSQLWLVCEYCPGGSVKTLMRATNDKLSEKYIIIVARELAKALQGIHQAGIIHRDVKAANVLIHENGGLQLCDFGIAAGHEGHADKRKTFVGTLHWMPPELYADKPEYSDEVDVWGYGCTLFECATGAPPNSDLRERQQLKMRMRRMKQSISLPEKSSYSDGLRRLVKYSLNPDPVSRPSMQAILQHDFLAETEKDYPTRSLTELVQYYYSWLFGGGQRVSLFMAGGAAAASDASADADEIDDWNFSMTQDFEKRMSAIFEIPDLSEIPSFENGEGEMTPRAGPPPDQLKSPPAGMTATEKANFELRVQRGADLSNLFDQNKPAYEFKTKTDFVPLKEPARRTSDLPFRAMAEDPRSSVASVAIDLGDFDEDDYALAAPRTGDDRIQTTYAAATPMSEEPAFILPDAATIRAKRADSKGPREARGQDLTAKRSSSADSASDPTREEWTSRNSSRGPRLQEAAEITPTVNTQSKPRDTMGWSFADAMSAIPQDSPRDIGFDEGTVRKDAPSSEDSETDDKLKKHVTMEWSFSMAMAEAGSKSNDDADMELTPVRHMRPAPIQRTMTQPVTAHEVHEAYDDFSRPSTSMSGAYSESSSVDFDPFALDRRTNYDDEDNGPGEAEVDDMGMNGFYNTRGRASVIPDMSGPGPDIGLGVGLPDGMNTVGPPFPTGRSTRAGEEGFPGPATTNGIHATNSVSGRIMSPKRGLPASPRSLGHIRGNGSGASDDHGSNSSIGSGIRVGRHTSANPSISTIGSRGSSSGGCGGTAAGLSTRTVVIPTPAPPSMAAMAGDASTEIVEKELERLLAEFQGALSVAGEVVGEGARGRARRRRIGESDNDWEDEDEQM